MADVHLGAGGGILDAVGGGVAGDRFHGLGLGLAVALVADEQRIALQLGVYERIELNVRQLQQLDGLLQLRRDDKALALPDLESRAERQGLSPGGLFLAPTLSRRWKPIS